MATPGKMTRLWNTFGSPIKNVLQAWTIICEYAPVELISYLKSCIHRLIDHFNPYIQLSIHEFSGSHLGRNEAYRFIKAYLSVISSKNVKKLRAEVGLNSKSLVISMDEHERVSDTFNGVHVWWVSNKVESSLSYSQYSGTEKRYYTLEFHKKHREMVTESYLEHVFSTGEDINRKNRERRLYTNNSSTKNYSGHGKSWSSIVFKHPATFETLAMEPDKKQEIVEDLLTFSKSKDYYARIGKACKRGYLLYGPPGTGKSTMIAAMANLLNYDIYDLELTAVKDNTELKMLLIHTMSKSIIVIEDIDCALDITHQRNKNENKPLDSDKGKKKADKEPNVECDSKVTLSGLLNFIDGLWSASGGERIIIFTTNYVDKLDSALTRTGRMDRHVEMSYCSFEGFKVLAKSYLEVDAHPKFDLIQQLMTEVNITPADVAENLMPKTATEDADVCLLHLIRVLEELAKAEAVSRMKELVKVLLDQHKEPMNVGEIQAYISKEAAQL
ncbi:AAA-ATPase At3g28510-like [Apium graveolens]|uniref:AAA-ATPase At3g28510-like n=1 Tax=Apium graveolens TaxID=4045 RepID=UPI003D790507